MNTLRELRKKEKMTQEQLGNLIGKPKTYISDLESGKRDIQSIAAKTLLSIADILHTTPENLINPTGEINADEFEWEDGFLVVDKLFYDDNNNSFIVENDGLYYKVRTWKFDETCSLSEQLYLLKHNHFANTYTVTQTDYIMKNCIPRNGFVVDIGREITTSELTEIRDKYHITDDDISSDFEAVKGAVCGKKYQKSFTAIQVRVDPLEALHLERVLKEKGIEAGNISSGRVNIRIK